MKRQTRTLGSIVKIILADDSHSYGIILDKSSIGIFNIKTKDDLLLSEILKADILFIVAVYNTAITSGRWRKIGKTNLDNRFTTLPLNFIQDSTSPELIEIYDPNSGLTRKASKEECLHLECAAVWEAAHVESRILDYYNSNENVWVKQLQIK